MGIARQIQRQFQSFISTASYRADAGLGIVGSPSPDSDYWYHGTGFRSAAGPMVSPATATRLSAVFACTRVCAETIGSLPFAIFRERKGGGRDLAVNHPAYELLLQPNPWQTSMEFFEMLQGHLELRGNAYALKRTGNGRAIDQLIPLHPDRVRVFLLPDNRLRYEVTAYSTGQIERFSQDEILHVRGWSYDGIMGISTVSALAEVIGVGLAQQEHRGRYFRNNAVPGMSIETVKMTDEAREEMVNSISEKFSGEGAFKVFAPPPGAKITTLGLTNKDSQLIEASNATKVEICGAWRVPPHKIADLSRGTFGNIEQQNIEFATDCCRPRVIRLERRIDRDIVGSLRAYESSPGDYFIVFNMDALFRGDMKSRYEAYSAALPWMIRDEMRTAEGKNPLGGAASELLVPVNYETVSQSDARAAAKYSVSESESGEGLDEQELGGDAETPDGNEETDEESNARTVRDNRLRSIAFSAADRMVRREVKSLRKINDSDSFDGQMLRLFESLAPVVSKTMAISLSDAQKYLEEHRRMLSQAWGRPLAAQSFSREQIIAVIEERAPSALTAIALNAKQNITRERVQ